VHNTKTFNKNAHIQVKTIYNGPTSYLYIFTF